MRLRATEADWQATVVDYARLRKWRVAHFRPAKTEQGWRTAVSADGAGFPDLVLVRDRIVFAELKSQSGRLSVAQQEWHTALRNAYGTSYVWRPSDWPEVERILL